MGATLLPDALWDLVQPFLPIPPRRSPREMSLANAGFSALEGTPFEIPEVSVMHRLVQTVLRLPLNPERWIMVPTLLVALALAFLYWFPIRRWMARWGTRSSELTRVMAGDGLVRDPTLTYTMAVTVNARAEHIWPWLLQLGYQRGGLYSYDWLDRLFGFLDRPSATRILPEFQRLSVGDKIPIGHGAQWPVAAIEPCRALVLDMRNQGGFDWIWQFGLYAIDERRTRFVSRSHVRPRTVWAWLFTIFAIEPSGFLMTRRMLLGLKQRAEALAAERSAPSVRAA
jgi:hypothetical protein